MELNEISVPKIQADETIINPSDSEVLDARKQSLKSLEDCLLTVVTLYTADEVLEALARVYQQQSGSMVQGWYKHPGDHQDKLFNKAVKADQVSQKLLKIGRELEGK